ncbi:unnamed protein product, partial [Didymodactylos carnosus]
TSRGGKFLNQYRITGFENSKVLAKEIAEQLEIESIVKEQRFE